MQEFKKDCFKKVLEYVDRELENIDRSIREAHKAATDEESIPENKYDTRALEASYLAHGQMDRFQELKKNRYDLTQMNLESPSDVVSLGSLIFTQNEDESAKVYFLLPCLGGVKIPTDNGELTLLSSQSPLAKTLVSKRVGDEFFLGKNKECWTITKLL